MSLLQYCTTERQRQIIEMYDSGLSGGAIARKLGVRQQTINGTIQAVRARAAIQGHAPEAGVNRPTMPGYGLKRVSTLARNELGEPQWQIQEVDKARQQEVLSQAIAAATDSVKPLPRIAAPKTAVKDLLSLYTITDYHLGMYAWEDEAGANWDMDIAERLLMQKFAEMCEGTPDSEQAVFAQLGDLMHWDGLLAVTPTAKNVLDADTRFPLLVESAIRCMMWCVDTLLAKHRQVHVIMAEGNHDMASSVWLRALMAVLYAQNPRVTVEQSPHPYYAYEWGTTMLAWHHGHLSKPTDLPGVFASDPSFRAMWGRVRHTSIHTGHRHHELVVEKAGAIVEQHPTLAARDSHGSRLFEHSRRAAKSITYHKERGETRRCVVTP